MLYKNLCFVTLWMATRDSEKTLELFNRALTIHRSPRYLCIPISGVFILTKGHINVTWFPVLGLVW